MPGRRRLHGSPLQPGLLMRTVMLWAVGLFVRVPVLLAIWPVARLGERVVSLEDWLMDVIPGPQRH